MKSPSGKITTKFLNEDIQKRIAQETNIYFNLGQNAIVTTEDKLKIVLMTCLPKIESRRAWIAPTGILVAIVTAIVTASFKDFLFIDAATLKALFYFFALTCLGWLVMTFIKVEKAPSVETILLDMKRSSSAITGIKGLLLYDPRINGYIPFNSVSEREIL